MKHDKSGVINRGPTILRAGLRTRFSRDLPYRVQRVTPLTRKPLNEDCVCFPKQACRTNLYTAGLVSSVSTIFQ